MPQTTKPPPRVPGVASLVLLSLSRYPTVRPRTRAPGRAGATPLDSHFGLGPSTPRNTRPSVVFVQRPQYRVYKPVDKLGASGVKNGRGRAGCRENKGLETRARGKEQGTRAQDPGRPGRRRRCVFAQQTRTSRPPAWRPSGGGGRGFAWQSGLAERGGETWIAAVSGVCAFPGAGAPGKTHLRGVSGAGSFWCAGVVPRVRRTTWRLILCACGSG